MKEDKNRFDAPTARSLTTDCVDFWLDGPGDHTVRPCRPSDLEHAKAERAKIQTAESGDDLKKQQDRRQP